MADRRDSKNRKLRKGEYQRSDGRYAYKYKDHNGVDRWLYSWKLVATDSVPEGKSCDICLRDMEMNALRANVDEINIYDADKVTLNQYFDKYMKTKTDLREQTRVHYRKIWSWYVEDTLGKRSVGSIHYSDILKLYTKMVDKDKLSQGTIRNVNLILHPLFNIAVRDNLIRSNPVDGVMATVFKNRKSIEKAEDKALTEEQQKIFLKYLREHQKYRKWYRLIVFLLGTGCRIGEARALTWDDCDFTNRLIYINRQLVYYRASGEDKYKEHIAASKSSSGIRTIPMFQSVMEVLLEEKYLQDRMRIKSETVDSCSGFIFVRRTGKCLDEGSVTVALKMLAEKCNDEEIERAQREHRDPVLLPLLSAHDLRHTFCTRMCENESNVKVIQEVMGHSDISITLNIYAEATNEAKIRSFKNLEGKVI